VRRPSTASKYSSKLARLRTSSSHNHGHKVHLHVRTIMASKCISKLSQLQPLKSLVHGLQSLFPNSLDHGVQSTSRNPHDYGLHVCTIIPSKCISKIARLWPLNPLDYGLLVYLQIRSIAGCKCISKPARSRPRSGCLSSLDHHFQEHLELLSSTACS